MTVPWCHHQRPLRWVSRQVFLRALQGIIQPPSPYYGLEFNEILTAHRFMDRLMQIGLMTPFGTEYMRFTAKKTTRPLPSSTFVPATKQTFHPKFLQSEYVSPLVGILIEQTSWLNVLKRAFLTHKNKE